MASVVLHTLMTPKFISTVQTFPLGSSPVYLAVNFPCPFECLPGISDPAGLSIFLPKLASLQYNLSCWLARPSTPLPKSEPGSASWYLLSLIPYPHLSVLSPDYILNVSMSFHFSYHHPVQATIVSPLDNCSSLLTMRSHSHHPIHSPQSGQSEWPLKKKSDHVTLLSLHPYITSTTL